MKGTNDGGEAKMDKELVLYEFINLLVRIAFQRANPTYGNFGNKREVVPPPGCVEEMITNCILPNARRDTSAEFKETVMQDEAVKGVLAEYKDKLKAWYTKFCAEDTLQSDKLGMEQFLRYCNEKGVIGIWTVLQQSDINGDPNAGFEHKFKLSIPTVKTAFMDSQNQSQIGAAQASNVDEMAVLDFEPEVRRDASCTAPPPHLRIPTADPTSPPTVPRVHRAHRRRQVQVRQGDDAGAGHQGVHPEPPRGNG